ncbi:NUDIX hydrolase domain-like protein [Gorgonomyces haynaldii]|nr:NUDIX hydrolase domain-like protein [Gorgonomyces haynaldii]
MLLQDLKSRISIPKLCVPDGVKRASVAIILRHVSNTQVHMHHHYQLSDFEILYIVRAENPRDRWSKHVAFPGGRANAGETDVQCCVREVKEEVGLDLGTDQFQLLGRLDDREVKTPASAKTVMVLCCFVFLQTFGPTPRLTLDLKEVSATHWVPCGYLSNHRLWEWTPVHHDIYRQILPMSVPPLVRTTFKTVFKYLLGGFNYYGIPIPGKTTDFPLWGLTLWMTIDLLGHMKHPNTQFKDRFLLYASPRYTSPDVDFLIQMLSFGKQPLAVFIHRSSVGFGYSILWAVRVAAVISIALKAIVMRQVFKMLWQSRL